MKTLVVAEKPSVGRDIARVLHAGKQGDGCLIGADYTVTWAVGHLVTLKEPDEIDPKYKKWSSETLPILPESIPLKVISQSRKQFETVKKLLNSDEFGQVICATDAGREGELIFRLIYQMAGCKKPALRLWISSMTDAAIQAGFASLKSDREYDALYASAKCRSEADWLVGMNASRAFTLRYNTLLSAGRVQTPTLALIVRRDKEIAAFVSEHYYEVTAVFDKYSGVWFDRKTQDTHIKSKEIAEQIKARAEGKTGIVTECTKTRKREAPERLYDLTTLQRDANRRFGYSADKTLDIAQSLYEKHKVITYPRTDSRFLPTDMIPKVRPVLQGLPEPYKAFYDMLEPWKDSARIYDNSKISDHHAIIPTEHRVNLDRLTVEEKNVFDLVARRLLANHFPDREYDSLKIVTEVGEDAFKTNCVHTVIEGWRVLYPNDKKDTEADIPEVQKGEQTQVKKAMIAQKKTQPPSPYTDDTLLKAMEDAGKSIEDEELREKMKDSGLGTPATRAAIITRLIQVGYVKRDRKQLKSTEKGRLFVDTAPEEMTSAVTTGKWERALANMSHLTERDEIILKRERFMQSIRRYSEFLVDYAAHTAPFVVFPAEQYKKKGSKPNGRSNKQGGR